jgi:hypothetical protein
MGDDIRREETTEAISERFNPSPRWFGKFIVRGLRSAQTI